jgi:hypothetical protein
MSERGLLQDIFPPPKYKYIHLCLSIEYCVHYISFSIALNFRNFSRLRNASMLVSILLLTAYTLAIYWCLLNCTITIKNK